MSKYFLIEATEVPTTMMERIQNEGVKEVDFKVERHGFFGKRIVTKRMLVAWNWNPKSLVIGREIKFPS